MRIIKKMNSFFKSASARSFEITIVVFIVLIFFALVLSFLNFVFPLGTSIATKKSPEGFNTPAGLVNMAVHDLLLMRGDKESSLFDTESVSAILTRKHNTVKSKSSQSIVWKDAESGMPLYNHDAVQTFQKSSAVITFDGGSSLRMGDNSLVIIRRAEQDIIFREKRSFLVVVDGEMQGKFTGSGEKSVYVEVATPNAVARIRNQHGTGDESNFKITVNPDQSSTFALIEGVAEVSAMGKKVTLKANQMTTVAFNKAPGTPLSLPEPVRLLAPLNNKVFYYRDLPPKIQFTWKAQSGATGYHYEIARDPFFEDIVAYDRTMTNRFIHGNLKKGTYYWRVNTLKGGGKGIYSQTRQLQIIEDHEPPVLTVNFPHDPVRTEKLTIGGKTEPGARVFVDGMPVTISNTGTFEVALSLDFGITTVVVEAMDKAGNVSYSSKLINMKF